MLIVLLGSIIRLSSAQQADMILQGRIVEKDTWKPIEYANITIKNASVGTLSNAAGEFEFHIPKELLADSLVVSMLGYTTYKVVAQYAQPNAIILLEQKSILLAEIMIHDKIVSGDEIMSQAIKNIAINYPTQPHTLNGFFRQVQKVDHRYTSVLEAAVDIFDPGYGSKKSAEASIIEIRRSNYLKAKPYVNIADTFYTQKYNALKGTVRFNHVRAIASIKVSPTSFFTGKYTYTLDSAYVYGNKTVYSISAVQKSNKGYLKDPLKEERINTIMVDAETFGILQVKFDYHPKGNDVPQGFVNVTKTNDSILSVVRGHTHVYEFNQYQGLLYLKYIRWSDWVEDYNVNRKKVSHVNEYRHELLINHVATDVSGVTKAGEPVNPAISLYKQARNYDAAFWKNYNVLYESQQERTLIDDLMKEISREKVTGKP